SCTAASGSSSSRKRASPLAPRGRRRCPGPRTLPTGRAARRSSGRDRPERQRVACLTRPSLFYPFPPPGASRKVPWRQAFTIAGPLGPWVRVRRRPRRIFAHSRETSMATQTDPMEKVGALMKRRGFVFPSSEIYGGLAGCYDYGPVGVALKRQIRNDWWRATV